MEKGIYQKSENFELKNNVNNDEDKPDVSGQKTKKPNRFSEFLKRHKKPLIIVAIVILLFGIGAASWFIYRQPTPTTSTGGITTTTNNSPAAPTTVADPLTGLQKAV